MVLPKVNIHFQLTEIHFQLTENTPGALNFSLHQRFVSTRARPKMDAGGLLRAPVVFPWAMFR